MDPIALLVAPILAQENGGGASLIGGLLPLILIVGVFWLLLIRPQQKRAKQHRELVSAISAGDRVVTVGGLYGTVQSVDEDTIRVEVSPQTTVTMSKSAVARRILEADSDDTAE